MEEVRGLLINKSCLNCRFRSSCDKAVIKSILCEEWAVDSNLIEKKNRKIVIINGKPRVGKDTFVNLVKKNFGGETSNISSIDFYKEELRILGLSQEKTKDTREILSKLKSIGELFDVNTPSILSRVERESRQNSLIFLHIREPILIDLIKQELELGGYDVSTLIIHKPENDNLEYYNDSDDDVFRYSYDLSINNDGNLDDLEKEAVKFIKEECILW